MKVKKNSLAYLYFWFPITYQLHNANQPVILIYSWNCHTVSWLWVCYWDLWNVHAFIQIKLFHVFYNGESIQRVSIKYIFSIIIIKATEIVDQVFTMLWLTTFPPTCHETQLRSTYAPKHMHTQIHTDIKPNTSVKIYIVLLFS